MPKRKSEHALLVEDSVNYLNSLPECFAFPIIPGPYGMKGIADILACLQGRFVAIEIKIGDDQPTAHQCSFLRRIIRAFGVGRVCRSLDEIKQLARDYTSLP